MSSSISVTTMHTTLLVTDVLEHICELADPVTLSVMAQTARVLHEPAIYVLWRVLPDLLPLLQCFPTDCWAFEGDTFVSPRSRNIFQGTIANLLRTVPLRAGDRNSRVS